MPEFLVNIICEDSALISGGRSRSLALEPNAERADALPA